MVARPRNMINSPKALVNISRPRTSTRTMEVRVTREAMVIPNIRLRMMNSVKVVRRGKMMITMPVRKKLMLVNTRGSTQAKSERYPQPILPTVLEMPMTESNIAASSAETSSLLEEMVGR